jgi:cell division protein FtsI/penicillin-binding protein 2
MTHLCRRGKKEGSNDFAIFAAVAPDACFMFLYRRTTKAGRDVFRQGEEARDFPEGYQPDSPGNHQRHDLTINWGLQQFISENAVKYKLHYGAIVVMDARTGDILAMYGHKTSGQDCGICLDANHAASIFKLVTAVAAMDQGGYTSHSVFSYTGNAHTLYKNQLVDRKDRWTADITLADAFAYSNNVVFGKIGTHYLGETPIYLTALKLGFWKSPLDEIACAPSTIFFPRDEYSLAELACGFNRQTKMSPLHAAHWRRALQ